MCCCPTQQHSGPEAAPLLQVTRAIPIHSTLRHTHIIDIYAAGEEAAKVDLVKEYAYGEQDCLAAAPSSAS